MNSKPVALLTKDIYDDGQDCHPPGYIANVGDVVLVESMQVRHKKLNSTRTFTVYSGEFKLCPFDSSLDEKIPTKAAEIVRDTDGNVLWVEQYIFNNAHNPGERFIKNSMLYTVVKSVVTYGQLNNILVEYVVKESNIE